MKGYGPDVVKNWNANVGGEYSIGEYWDQSVTLVNNWVTASGSGAFDFPLMYSMTTAFNNGDLTALIGAGLVYVNPSKAYTFVANHDVDQIGIRKQAQRLCLYTYI